MVRDTVEAVKNMLRGRAYAYRQVFSKDSVQAKAVLKDLAKFCRAHESSYHPDARVHAAMEGRREVWLRIQEYLKLEADEIYELHKVKSMMGDKR